MRGESFCCPLFIEELSSLPVKPVPYSSGCPGPAGQLINAGHALAVVAGELDLGELAVIADVGDNRLVLAHVGPLFFLNLGLMLRHLAGALLGVVGQIVDAGPAALLGVVDLLLGQLASGHGQFLSKGQRDSRRSTSRTRFSPGRCRRTSGAPWRPQRIWLYRACRKSSPRSGRPRP